MPAVLLYGHLLYIELLSLKQKGKHARRPDESIPPLFKQMESILFSLFGKSSSQGGPQFEFEGMIGMIVQCCKSFLNSGHYMVFPGSVVICEIPVYTDSALGSFYNRRKRD